VDGDFSSEERLDQNTCILHIVAPREAQIYICGRAFDHESELFTLAASAEDAAAFEHPMTGDMGILTFTLQAGMGAIEDKHNLLRGARVESDKPNGQVDVLDWFRFAEKHVPKLAEKLAGHKDYHIEMRGREPDFPLLSLETD